MQALEDASGDAGVIVIRAATPADIGACMALKAEPGWNQVESDWRRFLELGAGGCFVAVSGGRTVGSVTTCRFGPVGWIAMLLVTQARRGEGIGRALLLQAISRLEGDGARSIRLDATPEGRPLYESLGFVADFELRRHAGVVAAGAGDAGGTRAAGPGELAEVVDFDRSATATDRRALLGRLLDDDPLNFRLAGPPGGPILGYIAWRPGAWADQIGPCIAGPSSGAVLLDAVASRLTGRRAIVDIPVDHAGAAAWAARRGLVPTRDLTRMTRGEPVAEDVTRIWASSGPEMG